MKNRTEMGLNRTGTATSPVDSRALEEGAASTVPPPGDASALAAVRRDASQDAQPVGSVPPPVTLKGAAKVAVGALKGNRELVLVDRLGERLAFERTGIRLYEALLAKYDALGSFPGGPGEAELRRFHDDEARHMAIVRAAIETLGADSTAVTPAADLGAVESLGLVQVLSDPRTTLPQALHALLVAELADNEGWSMLIELATAMGHDQLAAGFRAALENEHEHLESVRGWVSQAAAFDAGAAT